MPEKKSIEEQEQDLKAIKEWLLKQPHLPKSVDDMYLKRFLHTCNFSLEKSKKLIDLFYTIRSQAPEIFDQRDPKDPAIQNVFKTIDMIPLPNLTKSNYKVFLYRLADYDPENYNFVDAVKTFFMVSDARMLCDNDFPDGEIPIFDMNGFSLKHIMKIVLPVAKKYFVYSQEAHPIKLRQIHIINATPFLDRLLTLIKPFMKSEVVSLLNFHLPNSDTLYKFVPKELLPEEYGGQAGKLSTMKAYWIQKVLDKRDYFLDESKWRVDESKRPVENENAKQHFGIQGSFRSLSID